MLRRGSIFVVVELVQVSLLAYRPCSVFNFFLSEFRVQVVATAMHATVSVHRTPHQTHSMRTFFSCVHAPSPVHLHWLKISECVPKVISSLMSCLSLVFPTSRLSAFPFYLVSDHDDYANRNPNKKPCVTSLRGEHGRLDDWTSNTFITQETTDNIVMWEHGSALSIGCTSGLRFCWRPRGLNINLGVRGGEFYVFSEVEHSSP